MSWRKFQEDPVVVTIERNHNEWRIPLPAIILCPPNVMGRTVKKTFKEYVAFFSLCVNVGTIFVFI